MAIIAIPSNGATVQSMGPELSASVNLSAALMDMLSTVYSYGLLAAVREAIQNGCDAARRKGLRFSEGVLVELPTADNLVVSFTDRGAGMTHDFMTSTYLSFGSSTKAGDNGSAGGLGVGRWAAYGYIREAYISTTSETEMVERTYFQYQGSDGTPKVSIASEIPGTTAGTKVFFPIKENDLQKVYHAVTWLKNVMQLTMGDSFSVDKPNLLHTNFPEHSGFCLELGDVDASLAGVQVYPMKSDCLQYTDEGYARGSLVVLTNKEAGVGGLPFHIRNTDAGSIFSAGMVVEIPMSFRVPFMPSREEIKYTDEVKDLMRRISNAAHKKAILVAEELYKKPTAADRAPLNQLFGSSENWHSFCLMARRDNMSYSKELRMAMGGSPWSGRVELPCYGRLDNYRMISGGGQMKYLESHSGILSERTSKLTVPKSVSLSQDAFYLVVNDLKSGGIERARRWAMGYKTVYAVLLSNKDLSRLEPAVEQYKVFFGSLVKVVYTSSLPEAPKAIVKGTVTRLRATAGLLTAHCLSARKAVLDTLSFTSPAAEKEKRVWILKDGASLGGFEESVQLKDLVTRSYYGGSSAAVLLEAYSVKKLYLLTPKQVNELAELKERANADGYMTMTPEELLDEGGEDLVETIKALQSWVSFEEMLAEIQAWDIVQSVVRGELRTSVEVCHEFRRMIYALRGLPMLELKDTAIDKAFAPYIDVVTGEVLYDDRIPEKGVRADKLITALTEIGLKLKLVDGDESGRNEFIRDLRGLGSFGHTNYTAIHQELCKKFPLLKVLNLAFPDPDASARMDAVKALARIYR